MLNACILLKVIPTRADKILNSVRSMSKVEKAYFTFGRFDIVIFAEVEDYKELRELANNVNGVDGVRSTETLSEA